MKRFMHLQSLLNQQSIFSAQILVFVGILLSRFFQKSERTCRNSIPRSACVVGTVLTHGNNESAGKKKSVQITHAGVKSKATPYYKLKYERIAKRRGKKLAIIAITRMILTAVYHLLESGEVWIRLI